MSSEFLDIAGKWLWDNYGKEITNTFIKDGNKTTATALDFDLIRPEEGEVIQAVTRAATGDLKRAISARRSGASYETWARIMDLVDASLAEVSRLLAEKGAK